MAIIFVVFIELQKDLFVKLAIILVKGLVVDEVKICNRRTISNKMFSINDC